MKDHSFSQSVLRFLNGKGFYIALVFCLAALGGSGWYLWQEFHTAKQLASQVSQVESVTVSPEEAKETEPITAEDESPSEEEPASAPAHVTEESEEEPEGDSSAAAAPEEELPDEETAAETAAAAEVKTEEDKEALETAAWVWPLDGQVVSAFSADNLSYNAALKDWRTHEGVDLSAQLGDNVAAAHAGTVTSVRDDVLLGKSVTMDLGEGLTATYGNLSEDVSVSAGDVLRAGDPIGTVGETAAGEHNDTPWLHFDLRQDGEAVDPLSYLSPVP